MGHVRVEVEILNPVQRERAIKIDNALVDTGATRTTINRSIADRLGLEIVGTQRVRTADGSTSIDQSYALVRLNDKQTFGDVWVSDTYPGVLIGVITLEALGLAVDPVGGRLVDTEFLLL